MLSHMDFIFDNPELVKLTKQYQLGQYQLGAALGVFIGNLISNGMAEYIGEKIILGTENTVGNSWQYCKNITDLDIEETSNNLINSRAEEVTYFINADIQ